MHYFRNKFKTIAQWWELSVPSPPPLAKLYYFKQILRIKSKN